MKKSIAAILMALSVVISGCTSTVADVSQTSETVPESSAATASVSSELFSDRDFETDYDESNSAHIELDGDRAVCSSNAVQISGSTVTIMDEGTYILSGSLDDGMIIVNSEKTDKTQLVLNGVAIHSETSAPIYVLQSDKVFITLAEGSVNTLSNGGSFTAIDENNIDAAIFSKEDLTLNGAGALNISSPAGHGIVSKDSLTITGGTYEIGSASHGLVGKDDVSIAGGTFGITSGKDGIHAENADDAASGFVYIENGTFQISAEGDGISAAANMQISGGSFDITTGGGSVNAEKQTSDSWGGFMGGHGKKGGDPMSSATVSDTDNDSTSIKGIKASTQLVITGGTFTIDSADDSIHSNGDITVHGGTFEIASGDDAFHADNTLTIASGTVRITQSYEGLEGLNVNVSGGDIHLVASDDGVNAAGGTDQSGLAGHRGGDQFGGRGMSSGTSSGGSITISGGNLYVNASGDGIDANGTLTITGGHTTVCGPTMGDTATLDYDTSAVITGGTFIGTGASGMAQTFSNSEQGVIAVSVGSQSAGTSIALTDGNGNTIVSYEPEMDFAVVILSSPEMAKGETYTITVGSASGEFTAY